MSAATPPGDLVTRQHQTTTTRSTKIPGVTTLSGSRSPVATTTLTSTIESAAAVAMTGPKLRAVVAVDEIAHAVGDVRTDQRHVAVDRPLQQVADTVDLTDLLTLSKQRADTGARVEPADASAARPDPLGQRALRNQLELDLADPVQLVEDIRVRLPRERADDLACLARGQQRGQADVAIARVIADDRQVPDTAAEQGAGQRERHADVPETLDQRGRAVGDATQGLVRQVADLDHGLRAAPDLGGRLNHEA
jgi:hypothetical protein